MLDTRLEAVSLFANPSARHNEGLIQWILPGCTNEWQRTSGELAMKGMWSSEKSANATYRPALDALSAVNADTLVRALSAVVGNGCALMIGATRDQGAISLILMDGQDRHKLYPSNVQELDQALRDLIESLSPDSGKPPAVTRKR